MKYFYSYFSEKDMYNNTLSQIYHSCVSISEKCIYIDIDGNEKWTSIQKLLKQKDELFIYDISNLADEPNIFKERLNYLKEYNIELKNINGMTIEIDQIIKTVSFIQKTIRKNIYEKQMEGIQKALVKKRNGEGKYGRPKIILPDDFEENIKKVMRKEMKHDEYRKNLGFKRSTYFKFVKNVKDSWKQ